MLTATTPSRLVVLALALALLSLNAQGAETPPFRTWTNLAGNTSKPLTFERLDRESGIVTLRDESGKAFRTPVAKLSHVDQKYLRAISNTYPDDLARVSHLQVAADAQPAPAIPPAIQYEAPRASAGEPAVTIIRKERVIQVPVRYTWWSRTTERYGWRGRKCRVVWRQMSSTRMESRTTTVQEARSLASLLADPSSKQLVEQLVLDAPLSAGAISAEMAQVLDGLFPADQFDFRRAFDATRVDYQQRVPINNALSQIFIQIQSDPRRIEVQAIASDENDPAQAQPAVEALMLKVRQALVSRMP